ncbi:MAG: LysR family transcriptional regulator [Erythrobacter sp.]
MKIDRISLLDTFARVIETRSLSNVARDLGLSQSTVSRRISELESGLGVRLLNRNTRGMMPTRDGQIFYEYASDIVRIADEAAAQISGDESGLGGLVRIGTPASFANSFLIPLLPEILGSWPRIGVDLCYTEGGPDILGDGLDIAVSIGDVADQSFIKRKVGVTRWILVASKSYLDQAGRPKDPCQLIEHQCIGNNTLPSPNEWTFSRMPGLEAGPVLISGRISANSLEAAFQAAQAGLGIASVPTWFFRDLKKPKHVEQVLANCELQASDIQLLFPSRKLPGRTRAMLDFLADRLLEDNQLNP